jgi:uncharacterized protein YeaC (DUF1315 family)
MKRIPFTQAVNTLTPEMYQQMKKVAIEKEFSINSVPYTVHLLILDQPQ